MTAATTSQPAPITDPTPDEPTTDELAGPYSRLLGATEHNWCRAVGSGTGITVLSLLFSRTVDASMLQQSVDSVQLLHPRLRSHLLWIDGRPAFKVLPNPCVQVEVIDATLPPTADGGNLSSDGNNGVGDGWSTAELQDKENHAWMAHVETEMNINMWPEQRHCLEPTRMVVVRLYLLPHGRSLLVLRVHTAVCDRVAAATVLVDILKSLRETTITQETCPRPYPQVRESSQEENPGCEDIRNSEPSDSTLEIIDLMSVEDAIPPGKANKPFWAHGIDLLGYSLGTRRHALLPFDEPEAPRRSKFFHSILSVEDTRLLLQACERRDTSLYGAICAAGLKAAAAIKALGRRSEHFAVVSLIDCRQFLEPELSDAIVGFYHSALLNTHHVNEQTEFWELARRSSGSLDEAMKNRKHFTDMGDLNFLMFQALQHPTLTPSCSMRTSLLVMFRDTVVEEMGDLSQTLGLEHYVGCSSIHGVGPSLAIFDSIRKGALHFTGVYPTPLYSRAQMLTYVRLLLDMLVLSLEK